MKLGVARAASLDLPRVGLRDFAEEARLRWRRTVHVDEPRTPDLGRDIATSRDGPRFGSTDLAEEAEDIGEWRCASTRTSEEWMHTDTRGSDASRRPTKPISALSMPNR